MLWVGLCILFKSCCFVCACRDIPGVPSLRLLIFKKRFFKLSCDIFGEINTFWSEFLSIWSSKVLLVEGFVTSKWFCLFVRLCPFNVCEWLLVSSSFMHDFFFKGEVNKSSLKSEPCSPFLCTLWPALSWSIFDARISSVKLNMSHLGSEWTLTCNALLLWRFAKGNTCRSGCLRKLVDEYSSPVSDIL